MIPAFRHVSRTTRLVAALLALLIGAGCGAELRIFGPDGEVARFSSSGGGAPAEAPPAAAGSENRRAAAAPAAPSAARASTAGPPAGPAASQPEEVQPEPATLHSLAVRWPVKGDANANAVIRVQFRRRGDAPWREAWPLLRIDPGRMVPTSRVAGGWLFAGSIVDLAPDTEYEVRLDLTDPDGGAGERRLVMRTLAEPKEPADMRVRHVAPGAGGGAGSADDPFRGLAAAQASAAPGDLFLVRAGVYAGTWTVDRQGAPGRPIIYRAAGDGPVVLDGGGAERAISAPGARHVWFEGLSVRNAGFLLVAHRGAHVVVRRNTFEVLRQGLTAVNGTYAESQGFFVTDNVFRGPSTWPRSQGIESVIGLQITGAGHVVSHNLFTGLGDAIHGTANGRLSATDIHDNDFDVCTDDAVEADHSETNVRVFRNRITNCFAGISAQPVQGGPLYVFRNAIYNVQYSPVKLHNDTAGVLIFHNTSVSALLPFHIDPAGETVTDVITRNNLFIGTVGPALRSTGEMIRCDFDSDGYAWNTGPFALWNRVTHATPQTARDSRQLYGQYGAFIVEPRAAFASGLMPPANVRERYPAAANDLRPGARSAGLDQGVPLPNFSDGFAGRAPDLGCCELGQPLPQYGPRPAASR